MKKFKPGDWVEYRGKCYCQLLYSSNDSFYAYFFRAKYCEWIHKNGIVQHLRPRVELKNGKVWKIHHPNPYAKWAKAYEMELDNGFIIEGKGGWTNSQQAFCDRPTAIRALKRLVMRLGISVEVV